MNAPLTVASFEFASFLAGLMMGVDFAAIARGGAFVPQRD
jgi:hypothetical protein